MSTPLRVAQIMPKTRIRMNRTGQLGTVVHPFRGPYTNELFAYVRFDGETKSYCVNATSFTVVEEK